MYLIVDNYDSFVYNLSVYFEELGCSTVVLRSDSPELKTFLKNCTDLEGIVLSPGPKSPKDSLSCVQLVQTYKSTLPILGVCLGHQIIGYSFGAQIIKGKSPMHGKITAITHNGRGLFKTLPPSYQVTRYHSLILDPSTLPDCLQLDACAEDGAIMGIHHKNYPVYGVQFHPEAVLTDHGHSLLNNFVQVCNDWRMKTK